MLSATRAERASMHIEYKTIPSKDLKEYEVAKFIIEPDAADKSVICAMAGRQDCRIKNPARIFTRKVNHGGYDGHPDSLIAAEAYAANCVSDAFGTHQSLNIFSLATSLMKLTVDLSLENKELREIVRDYIKDVEEE